MPYLEQDDKLMDPNDPNKAAPGGSEIAPATSGGSSAPATIGGQPFVSQSGVGAGGFGGWTNIQSYLTDDKNKASSANNLNSVVGGQFDKEKTDLNSQASTAKSTATKEVADNNIGQDQASKLISQAAGNYNYKGAQNQDYSGSVDQLKRGVSKQYGGPSDFNYGQSAKTQEYGQGLGGNFQGVMSDVYNQTAGRTLGSGIQNLQRQVDQDNTSLADARQGLLSKYSGLQGDIGTTVDQTKAAVTGAKNEYTQNQDNLKNYLNTEGTNNRNSVQQSADAEEAIKQAFVNQGKFNDVNETYKKGYAVGDRGEVTLDYNRKTNNQFEGPTASLQNVGGVEQQRNSYNAIMDSLGMGDRIAKDDQDYQIGSMATHDVLTSNGINNPSAVIRSLAEDHDKNTFESGNDFRLQQLKTQYPGLFNQLYPNSTLKDAPTTGGPNRLRQI